MLDLFVYCVATAIIGLLVCVPMSVALWSVLGQSHFLLRLTGMIVCVLSVGAFFDDSLGGRAASKAAIAGFLLFLLFSAWAFKNWFARGLFVVFFFVMLGMLVRNSGDEFFDPRGFGAAAIAIPLSASLVLTFRLLGFRFVRLTGDLSDAQIELGTGKGFDDWLAVLLNAGAANMTRIQIVSFFRDQGVPFTYQRVLTDAYEMAIGRRILRLSADGTPQTVLAYSEISKAAVDQGDIGRSRWSLSQLMILSSVAACIFALARAMQIQLPDAALLGVMTLAALCGTLIAIPLLAAELSVKTSFVNRAIYGAVAIAVAAGFPRMIGLWPNGNDYLFVAGGVLCYTAWLVAAVILVRHYGYRIVLVGRPQADALGSDQGHPD